MEKGFPDRIKQYKVKWYMDPGNYGSFFANKVTYLAISVENAQEGIFLLFVSEKFEIMSVLECEDEQDAFEAVELPDDATWIRINKSEQQKKYNRIYAWRSLLNTLNSIKTEVFLTAIVLFFASGWFPRYGSYVLLFDVLRWVSLLGVLCGSLWIAYVACKACEKDRKIGFVCTRAIFLLLSFLCIFIGIHLVSIGMDIRTGTKEIYLTSTSYHREDVRRAFDIDYVSGEYEGSYYSLAVTGCDHSLLYDIEETHPMVKVTLYEKSKSVVKLEIVDNVGE